MKHLPAIVLAIISALSLAVPRSDAARIVREAPAVASESRALYFGGGGPTGQSWEIGMLKGLKDAGVDLTAADLVIGVSSGAVAAVHARSGDLDGSYAALLRPPTFSRVSEEQFDDDYFGETTALWQGGETTPASRIVIGERALAAPRVVAEDAWIERAANRLGVADWPSLPLAIVATDVFDGSPVLIDSTFGTSLARAVAASMAAPGQVAPVAIGESRYMDGNVAAPQFDVPGQHRIVALTPGGGAAAERVADAVRARGGAVMILRPDPASVEARGTDNLDPDRMRPSAEAGLRQAALVAAEVATFWHAGDSSR